MDSVRLPDRHRDRMRAPLGVLLPDDTPDRDIRRRLPDGSPVVTVGDRTTERVLGLGVVPALQIVDGMERRKRRIPPASEVESEVAVENPPAMITGQSVSAIADALASKHPVRILVRGEEDLLVLPVCVHAPEGTAVLYGQPGEGLVVARVDAEIKNKAQKLLDLME